MEALTLRNCEIKMVGYAEIASLFLFTPAAARRLSMSGLCSRRRMALALLLGLRFVLSGLPAPAQTAVNVLTRTYNNQRTGLNAGETTLTPANVNTGQFGMLFSRPVDGEVYAQPLYAAGITINGAVHNVLFVATMHDSVYAFDADSLTNSAPLWKTSYFQTVDGANPVAVPTSSIPTSDLGFACGGNYKDISSEVGILGTPVIDQTTGTLYLVARTKETGGAAGTYVQRLHAVNIYTGVDRIPPVVIQASFPSNSGPVYFDPLIENQRGALLLDHGSVYITYASHCDGGNYHGWVLRYDPTTLALKNTWCSTPDGWAGGIWQSGQGPSADAAGNLYLVVGNGTPSVKSGGKDYGNALVKLAPSNTSAYFTVADWFMPYNTDALNGGDLDSACGAALVPGPSGKTYAVMGGKNGWVYFCDTSNLGKYNPNRAGSPQNDNQIASSFQVGPAHLHGSSPFYTGPAGSWVYLWGEYSSLKAFKFNGTTFASTPSSQTTYNAPDGMPGGMMTVSANGTTANTGIVWANVPWLGDANQAVVPGVLRAFNATDMTKELWNSHQSVARDDFGKYAKYCPPVVANGKVYMATFSGQVVAYGLLPAPLAPTNLIATGGANAIGLNWTAGQFASTYTIKRSLTSDGTYTTIATGVTANSYTDSGLTNGVTYYYKVSGANNLGTSGDSNIASAKAVAPVIGNGTGLTGQYFTDPGDGTHLNNLTAARLDPTVNFTWNGAAPAYGVPGTNFSARWTGQVLAPVTGVITFTGTADDGVRISVNGQQIVNGWMDQGPTAYSGTIALTAGQKYDIKMEYYQGGGGDSAVLSWSYPGQTNTVIPTTQLFPASYAPTAPTNLIAAAGNQTVGLSWNPGLYAAGYNVKRGLSNVGPFTTIASNVAAKNYNDTGLTNGTTYYYVVSTVNATGESANSNVAFATPARGGGGVGDGLYGTYYPGNDANFTPETGTPFLNFIDPTINFNVDNGGVANGPRAWNAGVPHDSFTVVWTGQLLAPVTGQYTLYTNSDDGARLSLNSGSGLYVIISAPYYQGPTQFASSAITLTAGQRYDIKLEYFQGGGGATCQLLWAYPGTAQQIIPQINLFSNRNGNPPAAPVSVVAVGLNQAAQLSWPAVSGASTYRVKRSAAQNGVYTVVASGIAATGYVDMGLTNGTTYYYKVSASNLAGESADSAAVSVIPQGIAMILHYTYEDGPLGNSPDTITDTTQNGNTGQMIGGDAGFTTDSAQASYAALIGAGVHPALSANFNFGDQFTIFTYAKMNDAGGIQTILSNQAAGGASSGFALYVNDYNDQSHALVFEANNSANGVQTKTRTAPNVFPLGDGKYHAVAITVNRPLGLVNFYFDGQALTSSNLTQTDYSMQQPNTLLGVFTDGNSETAGAEFDDLQIYSGMLNPADVAALSAGGGTVTGQMALEGVADLTKVSAGAPLGLFTFEFRKPGTTTDLFTTTAALTAAGAGSAFGNFTLTGVPLGTYDVAVKGLKNLRVSTPNVLVSATGQLPNLLLPAGDANGDNSVDSTDFTALIGAFNSDYNLPGTGYDPTADFNFDGMVDSSDFTLLIGQFNNVGAN